MNTICKNCYYWCWDFILANAGIDEPYDFSRSFCGLHGCTEILDPCKPIDYDLLNGGVNDQFPGCHCGFYPKHVDRSIQLTLNFNF